MDGGAWWAQFMGSQRVGHDWVTNFQLSLFTLIPSAQRLVWAAKQALGKAALGALFA